MADGGASWESSGGPDPWGYVTSEIVARRLGWVDERPWRGAFVPTREGAIARRVKQQAAHQSSEEWWQSHQRELHERVESEKRQERKRRSERDKRRREAAAEDWRAA